MPKKELPKNENLKNALCYAPFVWIVFFFIENNKSEEFKKHIKYWTILFALYLVLNILFVWFLGGLLFVLYFWGIAFIMWKVYNGEEVNLSYIDKLESTIKSKMKD